MGPAVRAAWRAALPGMPPLELHKGLELKQPNTFDASFKHISS